MTPEILQRCKFCGVAIREPAMFCPECGKPLANKEPSRDNESSAQSSAHGVLSSSPAGERGLGGEAATRFNPTPDPSPQAVRGDSAAPEKAPRASTAARASEIVRHGGERTRETLHKASSVARGAIEDNVKRVEKIHHVSSVVLEEAHSDASLRFVLVALALFIVFVILLILSKVMG